MLGKTHVFGGSAAGLALCYTFQDAGTLSGAVPFCLIISGALVGSLLPDIDSENSFVSQRVDFLSFVYKIFHRLGKLFRINALSHRGIMHTLVLPVFLFAAYLAVDSLKLKLFLIGLIAGYISHLVLDALNPRGIPLLAPIYSKKICFLPKILAIDTGKIGEKILRTILICASCVLVFFILSTKCSEFIV